MRIGLAHKRLDLRGGTERDLYRTAKGLRDLGHEIHLFCGEYEIEPPPGIVAHRVPVFLLGRTAELWSFALGAPKVIRRVSCDVVVSFGRMLRQDVLRCGGGSHREFLERLGREGGAWRRVWQRFSVYHRSLLLIEKRQYRAGHFRKILVVSAEVKRDLMRNYSVPDDQIMVLYNGVDQGRFCPSLRETMQSPIRRQWKIPVDARVVLFVGSGFQRKGLDRMLSVWNSPRLRNVYLLVVGDDARLDRYKARAEAVAKDRIVFAGRQKNVEHYYAAADIVALPAVQEAFGNVVLEALASGLPVLVSRNVGAAEVLHGTLAEGVVNRPEDPQELENKLLQTLERVRDPSYASEARRLSEEYSWENHFHKLEACLMEVGQRRHSGSLA